MKPSQYKILNNALFLNKKIFLHTLGINPSPVCSFCNLYHKTPFHIFFSIHMYTHVQFEQLHKYIQNKNIMYKKWYTQKQSIDLKLTGISRKQWNI